MVPLQHAAAQAGAAQLEAGLVIGKRIVTEVPVADRFKRRGQIVFAIVERSFKRIVAIGRKWVAQFAKRSPVPIQHARQVAVGISKLACSAAVGMVRQCRIKSRVVFRPVHVLAAVSAVVVDELRQPFVNLARIDRVGDAGLVAPAEQCRDIVWADNAPTRFAGGLVRPAFDPRKHAFHARLIAPRS